MKRRSILAIIAAAAVLTGCSANPSSPMNTAPASSVPGDSSPDAAPDTSAPGTPDPTSAEPEPPESTGSSAAVTSPGTSAPESTGTPATAATSGSRGTSGTTAPSRTSAPEEKSSDPTGSEYTGRDIGGTGKSSGDVVFADDAECDIAAVGDYITEASACGGYFEPGYPGDPVEPYPGWDIQPQAGLLTGGEWNDNSHWDFWKGLYGSNNYGADWDSYLGEWRTGAECRAAVLIRDSAGNPVAGAQVEGMGYSAVTDNRGMAYLFWEESRTQDYGGGISVSAPGGQKQTFPADITGDCELEFTLDGEATHAAKTLDLMIMCDTTGSMGDELEYLKEELEDVVERIREDNANIPVRLSVNFYRDEGDEYVVREFPFTGDIGAVVEAIAQQSADGGGDTPEAVHTALASAVDSHDWDEDSVKVMFLVLDAPPHEDTQIIDEVVKHVRDAAEKGIRIVPVAASGVDKSCEYLLRSMAFMTGGTYTFLTDDSGIGYAHTEPTIGSYSVEKLNDMMVRIAGDYLA